MSAAMGAPFCAVVAGVDLRASRNDTLPTQRTLYQLQQAEATCPK
jgi:hypothetical protein